VDVKYRICHDSFAGYEVQQKNWYWPFWTAYFVHGKFVNTWFTLQDAENFAKSGTVVKNIGVDK